MFPALTNPTRVTQFNRGFGYGVAGNTGIIAAALAQDSILFALLCDPQAGTPGVRDKLGCYFDRLHLAFTTIVAFTTPVTAARKLAIYRGTGGVAATGGAAMGVVKKDTNAGTSVVTSARIATTAALTVAGITRETDPIGSLDLVHVGNAGNRQDFVYELAAPYNAPGAINPGELLLISNPVAMDAAGTFQLSIKEAHWIEAMRFEK